jgi:hypothetical protein
MSTYFSIIDFDMTLVDILNPGHGQLSIEEFAKKKGVEIIKRTDYGYQFSEPEAGHEYFGNIDYSKINIMDRMVHTIREDIKRIKRIAEKMNTDFYVCIATRGRSDAPNFDNKIEWADRIAQKHLGMDPDKIIVSYIDEAHRDKSKIEIALEDMCKAFNYEVGSFEENARSDKFILYNFYDDKGKEHILNINKIYETFNKHAKDLLESEKQEIGTTFIRMLKSDLFWWHLNPDVHWFSHAYMSIKKRMAEIYDDLDIIK